MSIKVTIWNEFRHEQSNDFVKNLYPDGMHEVIAQHLRQASDLEVRTATLDMDEQGLPDKLLNDTDVLFWWGHAAHGEVADALVDKIQARILDGMGFVAMHSAHFSKIFKRMMGTSCGLCWREAAEKERLWVVNPNHPITHGLGRFIELPITEMYGERFDIPDPDELLFISWFEGGEVFRSGAVWHRGKGRIFYFRPGHETYPVFYNKEVLRVLENGARWCAFKGNVETAGIGGCVHIPDSLEPIEDKGYEGGELEHPEESNA